MNIESTIAHFVADCEIRGLTVRTVAWYQAELNFVALKLENVSGITRLEDVKIVHLRQFVQHLMNTPSGANNPYIPTRDRMLSPYTVQGYVRAIKAFFNWCYQEEFLDSNPAARLAMPKAPEYLIPTFTVEHIEKMLATCDIKTPMGFRDYVLLLVFLDTGMRISELCGLKLNDIQGSYVQVMGKGRKQREIGLHPNVARLLWRYISKYRQAGESVDHVFIGRYGKPLQPAGVDSLIGRVKQASGIEGVRVSAHTFRHTFAKFYLERGGEIFDLSREMGHSSVQITEIYLKDYKSSEARRKHSSHSPIDLVKLAPRRPKSKKGGEK